MMLKCHRRSRAATRLGGSHAKVFYRVRDGRPPEVDHRLRPRRGHRRGRDEEVPRQPLGRDRRVDGWVPRAVARGLRERLPRLRPAKGARRARRRVRRRRGLEDPQVGRRLGLQERQERRRQDGQGDTRPRHLPRMGPLPRGRRHQGPRRRLRRGDRAPGDRQAAAARLPRKAGVRLRRHHARRQPEEVLDLRLPEVARQGQAGGRWRGSGRSPP